MNHIRPCNHDCFHCQYSDCFADPHIITKHERKILNGAHGGWENEMIFNLVQRARKQGIAQATALARLNISGSRYRDAAHHVRLEARRV